MVQLVDLYDRPAGTAPKVEAHRKGALHRAFSVFIFDSAGRLLIQQRATEKYHSPGLWANSCCSHPSPTDNDTAHAGRERLKYELGIDSPVVYRTSTIYKAEVGNGLTEHEYDHIFTGITDAVPKPNPAEAADYRYCALPALRRDIEKDPGHYGHWFRLIFLEFYNDLKQWSR